MKYCKFLTPIILLISSFQALGQSDDWIVQAEEIDAANYYGVTVANGMIGLVSSPNPLEVKDVVLNGVYDTYGRGRVSNILKSFNFMNAFINVNGSRLSGANISGYEQNLNMKTAVLETSFSYEDKVTVSSKMMALRHLPFSSMIIFEVTAKENCTITAGSMIQAPDILNDVRSFYSIIDRPHVSIPLLTSVANSPTGKHKVAASTSFLFPEEHGFEPRIIHEDWDYNNHWAKFTKTLKKGETYEFVIVGSTVSTEHFEDPHNEAERLTIYAALEGKDRLIRRHNTEWEKLWRSDIIIEGDKEVQKDIRFSIYHLYSFAREGTAYSLSPMGLSGLGYNGHVFWDTELWMFPPLLMLQPAIAKSLLEYRFEMLEIAKVNAFSHGYKGAMYPWESADTGQEATPVWALTGPFQHHITGDIGWACWKYYSVTKDKEWLRNRGYIIMKEVADFWASRVERNGTGQYDIKNVIGANEYEENIDNNAYTNGMAKLCLEYASLAAEELNLIPNPDWRHVAENIPILMFEDGTTRENATYDGAIIKQADVNLLSFPLEFYQDEVQIKKDLAYYEQKLDDDGPAMGFATVAALHARLGNTDRAYELFRKSYRPNKVPPFGVMAETAGGTNPYFATGAGGQLLTVLSGFGGLSIRNEGIVNTKMNLPKSWKSLTLKGIGIDEKTFKSN